MNVFMYNIYYLWTSDNETIFFFLIIKHHNNKIKDYSIQIPL